MLKSLEKKGFEVQFLSHAKAILTGDLPEAVQELEAALLSQIMPIEEIIGSGGGETKGTQRGISRPSGAKTRSTRLPSWKPESTQ